MRALARLNRLYSRILHQAYYFPGSGGMPTIRKGRSKRDTLIKDDDMYALAEELERAIRSLAIEFEEKVRDRAVS